MHNKLLLSAAVLSLAFGLSACSVHKGMMKEDMGKKDMMMKEDKGMGGKDKMMKNEKMMDEKNDMGKGM